MATRAMLTVSVALQQALLMGDLTHGDGEEDT
jgi:hypothetical protein